MYIICLLVGWKITLEFNQIFEGIGKCGKYLFEMKIFAKTTDIYIFGKLFCKGG